MVIMIYQTMPKAEINLHVTPNGNVPMWGFHIK